MHIKKTIKKPQKHFTKIKSRKGSTKNVYILLNWKYDIEMIIVFDTCTTDPLSI